MLALLLVLVIGTAILVTVLIREDQEADREFLDKENRE